MLYLIQLLIIISFVVFEFPHTLAHFLPNNKYESNNLSNLLEDDNLSEIIAALNRTGPKGVG
jgi:hypothetical protein